MSAYSLEHVGIAADDVEALAAWYAETLGFREFFRTAGAPPVIFLRDGSGSKIEIFPRKAGDRKPEFQDRTGVHVALAVADFGEAVAELEERGVRFLGEPAPVFAGGTARFFADPEGNRLHIIHRPTAPWSGEP